MIENASKSDEPVSFINVFEISRDDLEAFKASWAPARRDHGIGAGVPWGGDRQSRSREEQSKIHPTQSLRFEGIAGNSTRRSPVRPGSNSSTSRTGTANWPGAMPPGTRSDDRGTPPVHRL